MRYVQVQDISNTRPNAHQLLQKEALASGFQRFQRKLPPARPQVPPWPLAAALPTSWRGLGVRESRLPVVLCVHQLTPASKTASELPSDDLNAGSHACPAASHGSKDRARPVRFVKWVLHSCFTNRALWARD